MIDVLNRATALAALTLALTCPAPPVQAAEPGPGRARFQAECGLCHSAEPDDGGGGIGPALHGLMGRPAATVDPTFGYTAALRDSKIVWDAATLDRFLAAPQAAAPGTAMAPAVPDAAARAELVAYFLSLKTTAPSGAPR